MRVDSVVTWLWHKPGYRSKYTAEHVNTMRRMVQRNYAREHRFICITDEPDGIDPGIEVVPLGKDLADIPNPTWSKDGPSCYRRLRSFAPEFENVAGKRFVSIDLDVVITGDLVPVWERPEPFVIFDPEMRGFKYNGSMWLTTAGARRQVWEKFDPATSPRLTHAAGLKGSDQAWIHYVLGDGEAVWKRSDGVMSYRPHIFNERLIRAGRRAAVVKPEIVPLPETARVVMFHGKPDPWDPVAMALSPWIRSHYR